MFEQYPACIVCAAIDQPVSQFGPEFAAAAKAIRSAHGQCTRGTESCS